jgi:hypothetical protein
VVGAAVVVVVVGAMHAPELADQTGRLPPQSHMSAIQIFPFEQSVSETHSTHELPDQIGRADGHSHVSPFKQIFPSVQ